MHRAQTVDWLFEVGCELQLCKESVYTGVNILDLYLGLEEGVGLDELQLVAAQCLFVAAKHEESNQYTHLHFYHLCDQHYTLQQHHQKEQDILQIISFAIPLSTLFTQNHSLLYHWSSFLHAHPHFQSTISFTHFVL